MGARPNLYYLYHMAITISLEEAKTLALDRQCLVKPLKGEGTDLATLKAIISQITYVQIDTISVVQRAHEHTLWVRMPNYEASMLNDLQVKERQVFEYWSHAAAYLPIEQYRYCLPRMLAYRRGDRHWLNPDKKVMAWVLDRIKAEGALMARDFKAPEGHKGGTWWNWKPAKAALEQLFMEGRLMIVNRKGFQKVYDLAERVLPSGVDTSEPTEEEYIRHLIDSTIRAHGLATVKEMHYLRRGMSKKVKTVMEGMLEAKDLCRVNVVGTDDLTMAYYTKPNYLENLNAPTSSKKKIHFLCPFDNAIIQRKRLERLFGFSYKLECYVPAPKRVVGYYSMPILWGTTFVGQLDAKADRKSKKFILKNLVWEEGFIPNDTFKEAFNKKLKDLMHFNQCDKLVNEARKLA